MIRLIRFHVVIINIWLFILIHLIIFIILLYFNEIVMKIIIICRNPFLSIDISMQRIKLIKWFTYHILKCRNNLPFENILKRVIPGNILLIKLEQQLQNRINIINELFLVTQFHNIDIKYIGNILQVYEFEPPII